MEKVVLTPTKASEWLSTSSGNRQIRNGTVKVYAVDMKAGRWYLGNDCAIFDTQGRLRNAHHRCHAVIASGCSIEIYVRYNVSEEEIALIDSGLKRTLSDRTYCGFEEPLSRQHESVIKVILTNGWAMTTVPYSSTTMLEFARKHREAIDFIINQCFKERKKGITNATVWAVFAKALICGKDKNKLMQAAKFLLSGVFESSVSVPGNDSLRALRDWLLQNTKYTGGSTGRNQAYKRVANMLNHFLDGLYRQKVTVMRDGYDPFPITLPEQMTTLCVDTGFIAPLRVIASELKHEDVVLAQDIGRRLYEIGYSSKAKNPIKAIGNKFSAQIRKYGKIELTGIGEFRVNNIEFNRVVDYIFIKEDFDENFIRQVRDVA